MKRRMSKTKKHKLPKHLQSILGARLGVPFRRMSGDENN